MWISLNFNIIFTFKIITIFFSSDIFIHLEKNLLKKNLLEKVKDPPNSKFWKIIKEEFNAEWIPDKVFFLFLITSKGLSKYFIKNVN